MGMTVRAGDHMHASSAEVLASSNLWTILAGATTNGAPAKLSASEELFLVDANGKAIGAPSAPNVHRDGFDACTWATTCA